MQGFERKALSYAPLAQPDRVFGYEPKGRGFESLTARQYGERACNACPLPILLHSTRAEPPRDFAVRRNLMRSATPRERPRREALRRVQSPLRRGFSVSIACASDRCVSVLCEKHDFLLFFLKKIRR